MLVDRLEIHQVVVRSSQWWGDQLYASLLLAYIKPSVLLSLVWQETYCVNVDRVEVREA